MAKPRQNCILLGIIILLWFFSLQPGEACTLWGAAGGAVDGGDTLIVKNRYCSVNAQNVKRNPGASSKQRYTRMGELLKSPTEPFVLEDFIRFSEDHTAGPDSSIWRTGSSAVRKRTLATWIVSVPCSGSPRFYLKTANPGDPEQVSRMSVEEALRISDRDRIPLDSDLCR
jgi:Acyl-coenzyme A:6-aminopenicillanic acid acyl-transferase